MTGQTGQAAAAVVVEQGWFKGMAVVIDDGLATERDIQQIVTAIRDGGGHPVILEQLPAETADLANFANAAFFIMDWNLTGGLEPGIRVPDTLKEENVRANLAFLNRLSQHRHAPVFIFTNDDPEVVIAALQDDPGLRYRPEESHILVKRKSEVGTDVYRVLNDWAGQVPSVIALKTWERNLFDAINALFVDFHNRSRHWPVMFWEAAKTDKIPPGEELGRLLTRLVTSRMRPLEIDLSPFEAAMRTDQAANAEAYHQSLMRVLEGERIVLNERLDEQSAAPGDFFEETGAEGVTIYWLNIRAECDCIVRGKNNPNLYLLKGKILDADELKTRVNKQFGNLVEKDNEAVVFAMYEGKTIAFGFRDLLVDKWRNRRAARKGRLLAPFVSRIIQRYAAYSQRPGLPRLPPALLDQLKPDEDPVAVPEACNLPTE
ncbi:MAG: hypothetical protein E6Q50_09295 [Lysobacter sp.]|nr:MAG: hypothetical protein E6Q50_09295 [Lysobacter sp.]